MSLFPRRLLRQRAAGGGGRLLPEERAARVVLAEPDRHHPASTRGGRRGRARTRSRECPRRSTAGDDRDLLPGGHARRAGAARGDPQRHLPPRRAASRGADHAGLPARPRQGAAQGRVPAGALLLRRLRGRAAALDRRPRRTSWPSSRRGCMRWRRRAGSRSGSDAPRGALGLRRGDRLLPRAGRGGELDRSAARVEEQGLAAAVAGSGGRARWCRAPLRLGRARACGGARAGRCRAVRHRGADPGHARRSGRARGVVAVFAAAATGVPIKIAAALAPGAGIAPAPFLWLPRCSASAVSRRSRSSRPCSCGSCAVV